MDILSPVVGTTTKLDKSNIKIIPIPNNFCFIRDLVYLYVYKHCFTTVVINILIKIKKKVFRKNADYIGDIMAVIGKVTTLLPAPVGSVLYTLLVFEGYD